MFQVWTLKKVGSEWLENLKKINVYFLKLIDVLKIWRFYWPGSGLITFCVSESGSGYNQSGSTSLHITLEHHCFNSPNGFRLIEINLAYKDQIVLNRTITVPTATSALPKKFP